MSTPDWQQPYGQQPYGGPPSYPAQPTGAPPYEAQPYGPVPPYGPQYGYPPAPYQPPTDGRGVAGFVLGLCGLVLFWIPVLGLGAAALGIILSSLALSGGRRTGSSNGLAIAGLVCGIIGVLPGLLIFAAFATDSY